MIQYQSTHRAGKKALRLPFRAIFSRFGLETEKRCFDDIISIHRAERDDYETAQFALTSGITLNRIWRRACYYVTVTK